MTQTEHTAIVLRHADYKDNDRMVTLLSPTRGRIDAVVRNCRRIKSQNLNASELFALGDFMLFEKNGRVTVDSYNLIESFYPLRNDYTRLTCGIYLLNVCEAVSEPEMEQQELFMLLLHTLARLAYSAQEWQPLLAGFLLHFSVCEGFMPQLSHCIQCGAAITGTGPFFFDAEEGGIICSKCHHQQQTQQAVSLQEIRWMQHALQTGSASWVNTPHAFAPLPLLRNFVESRLGRRIKSGALLPI